MKDIVITTERLCLKPLGSAYLETVNAYAMDYENSKYMCRLPNEDVEETGIRSIGETGSRMRRQKPLSPILQSIWERHSLLLIAMRRMWLPIKSWKSAA